jgi:hypothetical protein
MQLAQGIQHEGSSMGKQEEKLVSQAANARLVHMNDQVVFPLLQRNKEQALAQLCQEFKQTGQANVAHIAYISACTDLMAELEAVARTGDRAAGILQQARDKS